MKNSSFQEDIYYHWRNDDKNIVISACPGSGKTTTLLGIVRELQGNYLFGAFNSNIAEEINQKLNDRKIYNCVAKTMHSIGLQTIREKLFSAVTIQDRKYIDKIIDICKFKFLPCKANNYKPGVKLSGKEVYSLAYYIRDMFNFARINMVLDDVEAIEFILQDNGIVSNQSPAVYNTIYRELVKLYKEDVNNCAINKTTFQCDFIDMIFLPAYLKLQPNLENYDYFLVDEAQDLSIMIHSMIDLIIPQVKKWVAVGDDNQAIYGFSGASSRALDLFREKKDTIELPLSVCYRCPPSIIDEMNNIKEGSTIGFKGPNSVHIPEIIRGVTDQDIDIIPDGALVICRNSAPLLNLYFKLISKGKKAVIKGNDISTAVINFCTKYKYDSIYTALNKMEREFDVLDKNKENSNKDFISYIIFENNLSNFRILVENLGSSCSNVEELITQLNKIFSQKNANIELMTIHKAKGLEASYVVFLDENMIPSKFARTDEQKKQEYNLKFVAVSRAQETLVFMNTFRPKLKIEKI